DPSPPLRGRGRRRADRPASGTAARPGDTCTRPLPADLGRDAPGARAAHGILPEEHRPKVFNARTPQSVATFLVDGRVAGTWRYEKGKLETEPFGRLDPAARKHLREESKRLVEMHVET